MPSLAAIVALLGAVIPLTAQRANVKSARTGIAPKTPDGQPDLQGTWLNRSPTPLERPAVLKDRLTLTNAEVVELRRRAERIFGSGRSDFALPDDVFLAALANVEVFKSPTSTCTADAIANFEFDNRTSLIVDPPDGRLPPYTAEGQRRRTQSLIANQLSNGATRADELSALQRCISYGIPRLERRDGINSYCQIVQSRGYVVLLMEAVHETRIIPLDGRPHVPPGVRSWSGDSRGRWDDKTLVIDTTNFSSARNFLGSADGLHLIERLTRVAPDEIRYEIRIDDPSTWTAPWTALLRLKRTDERIFEYACHEGNSQVMESMLSGIVGNPKNSGVRKEK